MKRVIARLLFGLLFASVGLPLGAYVVYDLTQFQPRRSEIDAIIEGAAPQDRAPPEPVRAMLTAVLPSGPSGYAARLLARALGAIPEHNSVLGWHLNSALWWSLVRIHLSEDEQVAVILTLAPTGPDRRGFTSTALELYQRRPSELSPPEIAAIFALIRAPSAKGEMLERLKSTLLERYTESPN
jgi:hypothetical protein